MGSPASSKELDKAAAAGRFDFRVLLGTGLQAASRLATAFVALVIVALLARVLDKEAFGRYSATIALFQVLDVWVDCGSLQAAVRIASRDPGAAGAAVAAAVKFRRNTAVLASLTAIALAWMQGDPQVACVAIASLAFFTHAAGVGVAVMHADIDYSRSEALRVVGSVLGLIGTVILIGFGFRDAGSMLIVVYAGTGISNLLLALAMRGDVVARSSSVDYRAFRNEALSLGIGGVIRQAYYSANPILARALAGDVAGARFAPAYRLTGFSILVSVYAGAAALPALVRLRLSSPGEHRRFVARWTAGLALIGAAIAGAMFWFRVPLLRLLFGEEYTDSETVLAPMCLTSFVIHLGGFALVRLVAAGRDRWVLAISAAGLVVNLITNSILTPRLGAEGAAWASLATESAVMLGAWVSLRFLPSMLTASEAAR